MANFDLFEINIDSDDEKYSDINHEMFSSISDTIKFVRSNLLDDISDGIEVTISHFSCSVNKCGDNILCDRTFSYKLDKNGNIESYINYTDDNAEPQFSYLNYIDKVLYFDPSIASVYGASDKAKYVTGSCFDSDNEYVAFFTLDADFFSDKLVKPGDSDIDVTKVCNVTGVHNLIEFKNKQTLANTIEDLQRSLNKWIRFDDERRSNE